MRTIIRKKRMPKSIIAVLLAVAFMMTGCTKWSNTISGQDNDSLSVVPAADAVMEEVSSNGKTYSYDWIGEMSEEELARRVDQEQTQLRIQMKKAGEDEDKIALALQDYNAQIAQEQEEIKIAREWGISLTAQETANLAGVLMEEVYGLTLDDRVIRLYVSLTESETLEVLIGREEPKRQRVIWKAELKKNNEQESSAQCTFDAENGRLLSCCYLPSTQEKEDCISDEWMSFVIPQQVGENLYDTKSPAYEEYIRSTKELISTFLAYAELDQNTAVKKIEVDGEPSTARFIITYEDGRTANVTMLWGVYKISDWGDYPWKAFSYGQTES